MKRSGPLKRRARVNRRNAARRAANHARASGSDARIAWVQHQPCFVCGHTPSENARTTTGGMGRKADAATILPLCARHHRELHAVGTTTFEERHGIFLETAAALTESRWRAFTVANAPHNP